MSVLQKKYEGRTWIKAWEVKEITGYSDSTLARFRKKELIKSKSQYNGADYLYWYMDVKKLAGWD